MWRVYKEIRNTVSSGQKSNGQTQTAASQHNPALSGADYHKSLLRKALLSRSMITDSSARN